MRLKRNRKEKILQSTESVSGRNGFTPEELESCLQAILDFTSEGIILISQDGVILEWNSRVEKITGLQERDALGKYVWDIQSQFVSPGHKPELTSEFLMHAWKKEILGMDINKIVTSSGTIFNREGVEVLVNEIVVPVVCKSRTMYCSFQQYTIKTQTL
jgi:PAS domain S-box-containing protein